MTEQLSIFSIREGLTSRQWRIHDTLEKLAIGQNNAIPGNKLVGYLQNTFPFDFDKKYRKTSLQADIRKIRNNKMITRRIGSSPKGYWLMTTEDEVNGIEFVKQLARSHIETAISQGVSLNYFYKVLSSLEPNNVLHNQQKVAFSPNQSSEVKVYSDDLCKEKL